MAKLLIASDVDGTLLARPTDSLPPALFALIRRLNEKDVLFCAASGRSLLSLQKLFGPVEDVILYLPENGALAYRNGERLYHITMPRAGCEQLVRDILACSGCEVRVNTLDACYLIAPYESEVLERSRRAMGHTVRVVPDFSAVEGSITKISAFCPQGVNYAALQLLPRWQGAIRGAMTGTQWLDFTSAGKGTGLAKLCEQVGVPLTQTIAFGDNYNDLSMLEAAGTAYIMESACADLKQRFCRHTGSVLQTLLTLEPTL